MRARKQRRSPLKPPPRHPAAKFARATGGNDSAAAPKGGTPIFVRLATLRGNVFSGRVSAVEFAPAAGFVQLEPDSITYFSLVKSAEITLRIGKRFRYFVALNASVGLEDRRLTVLAEVIQPSLRPVQNCANPDCICLDPAVADRTKNGRNPAA